MESNDRTVKEQLLGLLVFIILCAAVSGLGSLMSMSAMDGWYQELEQPDWNPPDWVFGPVWSVLYLAIAISGWLVWRARDWSVTRVPLTIWGVQLVLNLLWTALFFGIEQPGLAVIEIGVLWIAILATILSFWSISRLAAVMLVPYLGWVSYAAALNYAIWSLN